MHVPRHRRQSERIVRGHLRIRFFWVREFSATAAGLAGLKFLKAGRRRSDTDMAFIEAREQLAHERRRCLAKL
jgi:hypothetical protein